MSAGAIKCRRCNFLGARIDLVHWHEVLEAAVRAKRRRERLRSGEVHVAKLVAMQSDSDVRRCTEESDIMCTDGIGILWGCRLPRLAVADTSDGLRTHDRCAGCL